MKTKIVTRAKMELTRPGKATITEGIPVLMSSVGSKLCGVKLVASCDGGVTTTGK